MAVGRERALEIVEQLVSADHQEEAEGDALLDELERLVPDPRVSDLIYWPDSHPLSRGLAPEELTPATIVELAYQYRPFAQ